MANKTKFEAEGYAVTVTGRHVQVTDAMKQYAIDKISKIERYNDRIIDVQITMDIIKLDHIVDIVMKVNHTLIKSHAATNDMYASVNIACQKLERQLRRYKKRLTDHHAAPLEMVDLQVNVIRPHRMDDLEEINDQIEEENQRQIEEEMKPHEIVGREVTSLKTLSEEDAVMKMELSGDAFLIFRHEVDRKLRIIYRRNDGDYGVIEPEA